MAIVTRRALPAIDHLVFAATDLEAGMDAVEALLGVRPVRGGRHPDYGTHNALLSLGPEVYLEVIAPDPELPKPQSGTLAEIESGATPRLVTWVLRCEDIDAAVRNAKDIGIGNVQPGSRTTPDGSILTWKLSDPYAMPLAGAVPFLIAWGDTPHPSVNTPSGGTLVSLQIEHPRPDIVANTLSQLGTSVDVIEAKECRIVATVRTPHGLVELQ